MIDREWLSDEEVERIATETEDSGHGWAGNVKTISHHGFFSPEALRHFVNQLSSAVAKKAAEAEREACARINSDKSATRTRGGGSPKRRRPRHMHI